MWIHSDFRKSIQEFWNFINNYVNKNRTQNLHILCTKLIPILIPIWVHFVHKWAQLWNIHQFSRVQFDRLHYLFGCVAHWTFSLRIMSSWWNYFISQKQDTLNFSTWVFSNTLLLLYFYNRINDSYVKDWQRSLRWITLWISLNSELYFKQTSRACVFRKCLSTK